MTVCHALSLVIQKAVWQWTCMHVNYVHKPRFIVPSIHVATLEDLSKRDETARNILLHQRNSQLKKRQSEYKWKTWPESGLPSSIDDTHTNLPNDEEFERVKCVDFTEDAIEGGAKIVFQLPFRKIDTHTREWRHH